MRVTDKYVYFWGDFPSNWAKCTIKISDDMIMHTSEQLFMYIKGMVFGDKEKCKEILAHGKDPKVAKQLGREVRGFDNEKWDKVKFDAMIVANLFKYMQNEDMKKQLLSDEYKGKSFVEASPIDRVYGIGCSERDAMDDKSNWNGENLLGRSLDIVREMISTMSDDELGEFIATTLKEILAL